MKSFIDNGQMTDPMGAEQSMEAILRHIRQQYEEDRLQEQAGEPESWNSSASGRSIDPEAHRTPNYRRQVEEG